MQAKPNILIVDDEPDLLEIMSNRLAKRVYAIMMAQKCADAFQKMKTAKVHVAVLDVMLPDKDVIQCLGEILKSPKRVGWDRGRQGSRALPDVTDKTF